MGIGPLANVEKATNLFKTPSNSLILEATLVAIVDKITSSTIILSVCAFFLNIAKRVS